MMLFTSVAQLVRSSRNAPLESFNLNDNGSGQVRAMIVGDPIASPEDGQALSFQAKGFKREFEGEPVIVDDWGMLAGAFVVLAFHRGTDVFVTGSGVIVAPGVALCASHVLLDHIDELSTGETVLYAQSLLADRLDIWHVIHVNGLNGSDVTLLTLKLVSPLPVPPTFATIGVTTRTPQPGERLHIVGFRAGSDCFQKHEGSDVRIEGDLIASTGLVTEVHLDQRDSVMMPWPCFGVECQTWGGMSGGPVFDSSGLLIGLLSTSYADDTLSYVSILWPALVRQGSGSWPPLAKWDGVDLLSRDPKACSIDRPEAFSDLIHHSDGTYGFTMNFWHK